MEMTRLEGLTSTRPAAARSANDNRRHAVACGRPLLPHDAVVRIFKPSRSVMTSGTARTKGWRLVFERRSAPYIEPLMGWTGGDDTLTQVELSFPTLKAAVAYAERQGLAYVVERRGQSRKADGQRLACRKRAFSDATLDRLGLEALQESYGRAIAHAANESIPNSGGAETYAAAMQVANDPSLSLDDKRAILMNWAWQEYLVDQAINEGMPENGRPSRLHEVELALLALENRAASQAAHGGPTAQIAA